MKTTITTIALILGVQVLIAQATPTPPSPPETPSPTKITVNTNSKSETSSVTYSSDSGEAHSSSSSISIKNNNSSYKFRASFDDALTDKVRNIIIDKLSKLKLTTANVSKSHWGLVGDNEDVFDCKLSEGFLRMYVDKDKTSRKLQNTIKNLGEDLREAISGR